MNTNQQLTGRSYKLFHQLPSQAKSRQRNQHPVEINFWDQKGTYRMSFDMESHEFGRPCGARKA